MGGIAPLLAITPNGTSIYASLYSKGFVSVLSTVTNSVVRNITVGPNPDGIAITPNGAYVYVANDSGSRTISVISTLTNSVTASVTIAGLYPKSISMIKNGAYAYVDGWGTDVSIIKTATNTVVANLNGFSNARGINNGFLGDACY